MLTSDQFKKEIARSMARMFPFKSNGYTTTTDDKFRHTVTCSYCDKATIDVDFPHEFELDDWADIERSIAALFVSHWYYAHGGDDAA